MRAAVAVRTTRLEAIEQNRSNNAFPLMPIGALRGPPTAKAKHHRLFFVPTVSFGPYHAGGAGPRRLATAHIERVVAGGPRARGRACEDHAGRRSRGAPSREVRSASRGPSQTLLVELCVRRHDSQLGGLRKLGGLPLSATGTAWPQVDQPSHLGPLRPSR
jgi:hypothetical protein